MQTTNVALKVNLDFKASRERFLISHYTMIWGGESKYVDKLLVNLIPENLKKLKCVWKPLLSPEEGMTIGDMVFRSPIIVMKDYEDFEWYLIPDLEFMNNSKRYKTVMDMNVNPLSVYFGVSDYIKEKHVYHKLTGNQFYVEKDSEVASFYLVKGPIKKERTLTDAIHLIDILFANHFLDLTSEIKNYPFESMENYGIQWATKNWNDILWNDIKINNDQVGGFSFIVTGYQSPNFKEQADWREPQSIWNQAWFSDVRTAYGLYNYGKRSKNKKIISQSKKMIDLALSAPQKDGLFPSVLKKKGDFWIWENSNRGPGNAKEKYHLADMSWTCLWLLKFYDECDSNLDILNFVYNFSDKLLTYQNERGAFPAWIDTETFDIDNVLKESAETGIHSWLLFKIYRKNKDERYLNAAVSGLKYIEKFILPEGKWEDFELYWSCSHEWTKKKPGKIDKRSELYNQNTLSMYWTAMAYIEMFKIHPSKATLLILESIVAEISLYQAVWNPPYLPIPVKGGFGVMTSDDEWNDARQSLFSELYFEMYKITGEKNYYNRGLLSLKASFNMMFAPENKEVYEIYKKMFPFFDEKDYGFEMENAFHGEHTLEFLGEFSIFSWGAGGAISAYENYKRNVNKGD